MKNLGESGVGDGDILSRNRMKDWEKGRGG
jgi:hypothetical protein